VGGENLKGIDWIRLAQDMNEQQVLAVCNLHQRIVSELSSLFFASG